eukprot:gb/GEZN01005364.1/.p1 GENE.gb/GEZN01005364.1/~~gb/GEZN01005364.1/.p1  ORF type:complete len:385 (+),score=66.53 gb/GEZN01005364.1/:650-1804(+)
MAEAFEGLKEARDEEREELGLAPASDTDSDSDDADTVPKKKKKKKECKFELTLEKPKAIVRWLDLFAPREKGAGQMFVLVGKSERGKTHFLRWLLYQGCLREKDPFQYGLIFVRTKFKHSYEFHWASNAYVQIYEGFLLDVLKKYVENLTNRYKQRGYLEPSFIVFDDLVGVINNDNAWFNNFIGTYRHYNITIFVAVQYLTGRKAISPIMREQTTAAIMFNSKTLLTNVNLYENYGQLFENKKEFMQHYSDMTDMTLRGTRHACMIYFEWEDDISRNYMSWLAPKDLPDGQVVLRGPDSDDSPDPPKLSRRKEDSNWKGPKFVTGNPRLQKILHLQREVKAALRKKRARKPDYAKHYLTMSREVLEQDPESRLDAAKEYREMI